MKVIGFDDLEIHQIERQAVGDERAKLLHQIERQRAAPIMNGVQEADVTIKAGGGSGADGFERILIRRLKY